MLQTLTVSGAAALLLAVTAVFRDKLSPRWQAAAWGVLGLVLLVAIPLPGTGAWTGALVADVLDIRMRTALPAIAAGVVIAGCITTAVTCGVAGLM